jgi:hypothetical protein
VACTEIPCKPPIDNFIEAVFILLTIDGKSRIANKRNEGFDVDIISCAVRRHDQTERNRMRLKSIELCAESAQSTKLAKFALPLVMLTIFLYAIQWFPHNLMLTWLTCGYETGRGILQTLTLVSFLLVFAWPLKSRNRHNAKILLIELAALACIPMCFYLAGTYLINNANSVGGYAD